MKVVCNENKKQALLLALHKTATCPFTKCYCLNDVEETTCRECREKRIIWDIKDDD